MVSLVCNQNCTKRRDILKLLYTTEPIRYVDALARVGIYIDKSKVKLSKEDTRRLLVKDDKYAKKL